MKIVRNSVLLLMCAGAALWLPVSLSSAASADKSDGIPRWIGATTVLVPMTKEVSTKLGLPEGKVLMVLEVFANSPATKAGLHTTDILLKFGDQTLETPEQLQTLVNNCKESDTVKLTVLREGKQKKLDVQVEEKLHAQVIEEPYDFLRAKGMMENKKTPLLVFLHGAGDYPGGCEWSRFPPITVAWQYSVFLPHGGAKDGRGYGWWYSDTKEIMRKIKELKGIDQNRIYLSGFSAGSHEAYRLALEYPDVFAGVIIFSGVLRLEGESEEIIKEASNKVQCYIIHGNQDHTISIANGKWANDYLVKHNFRVTFKEFEGGHRLPPNYLDMIQDAIDWFSSGRGSTRQRQ